MVNIMNKSWKRMIASFLILSILLGVFIPVLPVYAEGDQNQDPNKRYMVLVLDVSGEEKFYSTGFFTKKLIYTANPALEYVKAASLKFVDDVSKSSGENYIAVIGYRDNVVFWSDFSNDFGQVKSDIESLSTEDSGKNISVALDKAYELISSTGDDSAVKNVVLFSTGMTNSGDYDYDGHYGEETLGSTWENMESHIRLYAYANKAIASSETIKNYGATLYSIGLFQVLDEMPEKGEEVASFFKITAKDLASSADTYYPVDNPEELEFVFGEVAQEIVQTTDNEKKEITFLYQYGDNEAVSKDGGPIVGSNYMGTCYYTDDYFANSAYEYNPSLATMSLAVAMSAFGSATGGKTDYSHKAENVRKLFSDIGMPEDMIEENSWYGKKPITDSIGVVVGSKEIVVNGSENYTLIGIAIRGGGYEQEWGSNFTVGTTGQHQGFREAKDNVISFVKDYIRTKGISGPVKFWIMGYSRAGATSNLIAGAIDDGERFDSGITVENKDVYCYCFETPRGALAGEITKDGSTDFYKNIISIVNPGDLVPKVAPATWGFERYGYTKFLPSMESDSANYDKLRREMEVFYTKMAAQKDYTMDEFQMKKWSFDTSNKFFVGIVDDKVNNFSQGKFLDNQLIYLTRDTIGNRSNYVLLFQDDIREICSVIFGWSDATTQAFIRAFAARAIEYVPIIIANTYLKEKLSGKISSNVDATKAWVLAALRDIGVTDYNVADVDMAAGKLAALIVALFIQHPNYFVTLVSNFKYIGEAHYPELCFSWLASMDPNYVSDARPNFTSGGYRIVRINCPVDVTVKNPEGEIVAQIVQDEPVAIDNSYIYGLDEDGQKYVVLPEMEEYKIDIFATEDALVNVGIDEFAALVGDYTRNINYFDINMKQGEMLNAIIPAYSDEELENGLKDASSVKYSLFGPDGTEISPNSDLKGMDAYNAYHRVEASSADETLGFVQGGGMRQYGNFAALEATPYDGSVFKGWYENDVCVSTDLTYRVRVTEDATFVAQFEASGCSHSAGILQNEKLPDCLNMGYEGDLYCPDCNEMVTEGDSLPSLGHEFCNGVCVRCGVTEEKAEKMEASSRIDTKSLVILIVSGIAILGMVVAVTIICTKKRR